MKGREQELNNLQAELIRVSEEATQAKHECVGIREKISDIYKDHVQARIEMGDAGEVVDYSRSTVTVQYPFGMFKVNHDQMVGTLDQACTGGMTPLHRAVACGNTKEIQSLIERRADVDQYCGAVGHTTPLTLEDN